MLRINNHWALGLFVQDNLHVNLLLDVQLFHNVDTVAEESPLVVTPQYVILVSLTYHLLGHLLDLLESLHFMDALLQTTLFEVTKGPTFTLNLSLYYKWSIVIASKLSSDYKGLFRIECDLAQWNGNSISMHYLG